MRKAAHYKAVFSSALGKVTGVKGLHRNATVRAVAKNAGWLMADRFGRVLVTLLMSVLIARHLGPAQFGAFSYATAFVGLFLPLATFGLDRILVRDCIRGEPPASVVLGTTVMWRVVGGCCVLLVTTLVSSLVRPGDRNVQALVAILSLAPILQAGEVIDFWFQSRLESQYVAVTKTVGLVFSTGLRILLLSYNASVVPFAFASLLESLFLSIGLLIAFKRRGVPTGRWKPSLVYARLLTSEGWPLALNLMFHMLYLRISLFMLGWFKGDAAVGVFGAATRIFDGILPLFALLATSLFPPLVKLYDTDRAQFFVKYGKVCRVLGGVGWSLTVFFVLTAPFLLRKMYGPAFSSSGVVLAILAPGLLFQLSGMPRAAYLTIIKSQKTILAISISSAFMAICLNVILIPIMGLYGAATASMLTTFFNFFGTNFLFKDARPLAVIQVRSLLFVPDPKP